MYFDFEIEWEILRMYVVKICILIWDYDIIQFFCQRNCQLQKRVIHPQIVDIVIAMSSLLLPPYVILEIVDRFEYWSLVNRKFKIDTIIAADKSCKRIRSLRT